MTITKYPAMKCHTCDETIRFDSIGWDSNLRQARYLGADGHRHYPPLDELRRLHTLPCGCGQAEHVRNGGCRS